MATLTQIALTGDGLRGLVGTTHLTGCDVFAGPNGSGKTSRLQAITAGLRGFAEGPSGDAREYIGPKSARPNRAKCTLTWDGGQTLTRDLSTTRGARMTTASGQADLLVGPHLARWDLQDFAATSDAARNKILAQLVGVGGQAWDLDRCRAALVAGEAPAELVDELIEGCPWAETAKAWLDLALDWGSERYTVENAALSAARAKVTAAKERPPQAPGRLVETQARQAQVDAEREKLVASLATAEQSAAAVRGHQQRADKLVGALNFAERGLQEARTRAGPAQAALKAAQTASIALESPDASRERTAALEAKEQAARQAVETAEAAVEEACEAYREQRGQVKHAEAGVQVLEDLAAKTSGACRHCGGDDPLGLADSIEAARAKIEEAQLPLRGLEFRGKLSLGRRKAASAAYDDASQARKTTERAEAKLRAAHDRAAANLSRAEHFAERAAEGLQHAETARDAAEVDLQAHREEELPATAGGDLDTLRARKAALDTEHEQLAEQLVSLAEAQGREGGLQGAVAAREVAKARLDVVKLLQAKIAELQAEVASGAYAPITAAANGLLEAAGAPIQIYIESAGDWGATPAHVGHRVHYASLSDGERALVGASLAYAFAVAGSSPWKAVILDRLEAIDEDRLIGFLGACADARADGRLDNFVGALRIAPAVALPQVEGVTCVRLSVP